MYATLTGDFKPKNILNVLTYQMLEQLNVWQTLPMLSTFRVQLVFVKK